MVTTIRMTEKAECGIFYMTKREKEKAPEVEPVP
jgi:hypothetical protein